MSYTLRPFFAFAACLVVFATSDINGNSQIQSILIYKTQFEIEEGYNPQYTLIGQNGWTGQGSGWNGLTVDDFYFAGFGQQAYIGYSNFTSVSTATLIWRPLNYQISSNYPIIQFSVIFQIKDSSNNRYDDFRWSVYNKKDQRLFSVDFDNETLRINYSLDKSGEFYSTGYSFFNDGVYRLNIAMNFAKNRWVASINDTTITPSLPMTTQGYELSLGDIDASWVLHDVQNPGDNYMLFDEFTVTAETAIYPPKLKIMRAQNGKYSLQLQAEPASECILQTSTNLVYWTDLSTNLIPPIGVVEKSDVIQSLQNKTFFRVKLTQ